MNNKQLYVRNLVSYKKSAFTLAEVLITLGIVGVVASMTIPTLIQNHRKIEIETKLKKIYSTVNQAINMSNAEYGDVTLWAKDCGGSSSPTCTTEEAIEWFNTYIGKYLQIVEIKPYDDNTGFNVYLKDGSVLSWKNYLYDIGYSINKKAMENPKSGINRFSFRFNPIAVNNQSSNASFIKSTFEPYSWGWNGTREGLLNASYGYGCREDGVYCAKLIQYDGWKISKDYPKKL